MKFKNLRRPNRAQKAGIVVPPASKRAKLSEPSPAAPSTSFTTAEYERHIAFLQQSFKSKKWSLSTMITLIEETAELHRIWIRDENPCVKHILGKFPCLTDPRIVSNFFNVCMCANLLYIFNTDVARILFSYWC